MHEQIKGMFRNSLFTVVICNTIIAFDTETSMQNIISNLRKIHPFCIILQIKIGDLSLRITNIQPQS